MTEQAVRAHAHCLSCNKGYRVPDPDRKYTCKACGGVVQVDDVPAAPRGHLEDAVTCASCHAVNHHGAQFCDECGAVLMTTRPVERSEEAVVERHEANDALKRAYKWIEGITWFFRLGALAYAVVTMFAILALARPDVPLGAGILVVSLSTVLTVLMLTGALQMHFKPFVWTLLVASLAALVTAAHLIGPNPLGLMLFWSGAWAVLFWASLVPTLKVRRLMAEHQDMYILHHASRQTRKAVQGRSAKERHERLLGVMHRANRRAWKISAAAGGVFCVLSVFGSYTVVDIVRPPDLSIALEGFEQAWNDADLATIGGFFPAKIRQRESDRLAGIVDGHDWGSSLPPLDVGQQREGEDPVWVDYELDDLALATCWTLHKKRWILLEVELPIPPLEPVVERFLVAWRASDSEAIASFYPLEHQERMLESVQRSFRRRSWNPLPEVLGTKRSDTSEKEVVVTLTVESGDVTTKWVFRSDGRWGLHGLQFP